MVIILREGGEIVAARNKKIKGIVVTDPDREEGAFFTTVKEAQDWIGNKISEHNIYGYGHQDADDYGAYIVQGNGELRCCGDISGEATKVEVKISLPTGWAE